MQACARKIQRAWRNYKTKKPVSYTHLDVYKRQIVCRGFSLTEKVVIDQHSLLADNPMKYFNKSETNMLKVHIAKKFDLI